MSKLLPGGDAPRRPPWHLAVAVVFVASMLAVDGSLRHAIIGAWTGTELRQYALSALGSVAFWWGLAALAAIDFGRAGAPRTALVGLVGAATLFVPLAFFVVYHRFPNEDAFVFFANEWGFVFRTAASGATGASVGLGLLCTAAVLALVTTSRRVRPSRRQATVAVAMLVLDVVVIAASRFSPSLPLTADQVSLRLVTRLVTWRGSPPPFFQLFERSSASRAPPDRPAFNVLWIVHETVGARYLVTPDGRKVAPNILRLKEDPAVAWLPRLHSVSSCTDVAVPAVLSGVSSAAPRAAQLRAALPFDLARDSGAYTFVASSQRLDWAGIDRYLGGPFDRVLGAENVDPDASDLGVDDDVAYQAALEAMDEAARTGRPFVGLVRSNGTHGPYRVDPTDMPWLTDPGFGPGTTGGFVKYLNALHLVDKRFGAFWQALASRPWFDDTLVVVTADHGEAFEQHGTLWHCGDFSPEESWVPGALRLPRVVRARPGVVERLQTRGTTVLPTIDLFPTVAELLGWRTQLERQFDGHSMLHGDEPRVFSFTNCSDLRRCPVADFGVFDGRRRWLFSGATRRWHAWDELDDPLALHELTVEADAVRAVHVSLDASRDAVIARQIVGW